MYLLYLRVVCSFSSVFNFWNKIMYSLITINNADTILLHTYVNCDLEEYVTIVCRWKLVSLYW